MTTAILIQNETSTVIECVKTDANNYQFVHSDDAGLTGFSLNKQQASDLRDYLNETLIQEENWG